MTGTIDHREKHPLPAEGRIDVWLAVVERCDEESLQREYFELLSDEEQTRARRFLFDEHRQLFTTAHALVRTTLSRYADVEPREWRFTRAAHGKPEIAKDEAAHVRFNLSHTPGLAAVAVTAGVEVGLDVEDLSRREYEMGLARRYFAPAEVAALEGLAQPEFSRRFLEFWTLKEAYLKATGKGLSAPLDKFALRRCAGEPPRIEFAAGHEDAAPWRFAPFTLGDRWQGAAAMRGIATDITLRFIQSVPLCNASVVAPTNSRTGARLDIPIGA